MNDEKMSVLNELKNLAETDYKVFNSRIIPTRQIMLGVRMPALRKIAKNTAEQKNFDFVQCDKQNIYEMILLEGMVLSYMDQSFKDLLPYTEQFLDKVDNWAQIDATVGKFRRIVREKEDILPVIRKWLKSDKEFVVRAGLVLLLTHYVEKERLNLVFNLSQSVVHTGHYAHMANAWLISVCMAKYPEETIAFFRKNTLDKKTHNKAIQKSRESYRVSKEHKDMILALKL